LNTIPYNFGIAVLTRLILGGISLVIIGYLTRFLGPAGYGNYSLILAYMYIFASLADLGLSAVLVREISKTGADEKKIADNIFTLRLVVIAISALIGVIIAFSISYPIQVKIGIAIASVFTIFSSLSQVLIGIFQKYLRLYLVSAADLFARGFQLLIILILVKNAPTLSAFIWAIVATETLRFAIIYFFSRKMVKVELAFDFKYWLETVKTALPIAISLVFVLLYFKMDTVLLSLMKPAYDVGVYSVAYKILETVIFLPALYVGLVMPILSRHAFGDRQEFIKSFRKSFDILVIFALPVMAYLYLRATDIINIIGGRDYNQSVVVLKILSLAIMLIFFGNLAGNAVVALNLQKKGLWIYLAGAVFNLAANVAFIPRFSFLATSWTTVLTELFITFLLFGLIKKQTGAEPDFKVTFRVVAATALTVFGLSFFHLGFIAFSVLALVYFPILFVLGGFTLEDFKSIFSTRQSEEIQTVID